MYAVYKYVASATRANVLLDLKAIFTGETTPSNLSAACDTANTTITATVAAGWTDYDSTPPTNTRILRAPYSDDASNYKYAILYFDTSNRLRIRTCESWTDDTNTATNETTGTYVQRALYAAGGTFYLMSSARFLAVLHDVGGTLTTRGDTSTYGLCGVFERSRLQPWDTVSAAYPKGLQLESGAVFANATSAFCSPRVKRPDNTDSAPLFLNAGTVGVSYSLWTNATHYPSGVARTVKDSNGNDRTPLYPIYAILPATISMPLGEISSVCDVWAPPLNFHAHLDEFTKDSNTYVCIQASNNNSAVLAFRKG
jgi:hypothetical protein